MQSDALHPFAVEVSLLAKPAGHFGWAVRKRGKLFERSVRAYDTETKAHEAAVKAIVRTRTPRAW